MNICDSWFCSSLEVESRFMTWFMFFPCFEGDQFTSPAVTSHDNTLYILWEEDILLLSSICIVRHDVHSYIATFAWFLCAATAVTTVDRSSENLITIPNDIDTDATTLFLSRNKITRIDDRRVSSFISLEKLQLDYNGVEFISRNAFANKFHLSELRIQGHRLSTIPRGLGRSWKNLVSFYFGHSQLHMLAVHVINFTALTVMDMNYLPTHSLIIRELPSLKYFFAQECELEEFPDLSGAPHLVVVQLHGNPFTWVPQSALASLSWLRQFIFPDCRVMYLPDLSHLVSLEMLHAHKKELKTIPDICDLLLTEINLEGNPLESLLLIMVDIILSVERYEK